MMIILDTNVISEILKHTNSDPHVIDWFIGIGRDEAYTTAVNTAELLYGLALVPQGRRRFALSRTINDFIEQYRDYTIPYDIRAAVHYAAIVAQRREEGHPISVQDGMIAAIARANGASLATRNVKDFEGTGVKLINPWDADHEPERG
ncbi:type II toxin-antitoxin system VapC family toxin [Bifidobacterium vespertilionis]|nr:type II toxin-antitoxin system VapC family toxin [Bifidobacterium vespertilionis]